jgi:hypothetical protein
VTAKWEMNSADALSPPSASLTLARRVRHFVFVCVCVPHLQLGKETHARIAIQRKKRWGCLPVGPAPRRSVSPTIRCTTSNPSFTHLLYFVLCGHVSPHAQRERQKNKLWLCLPVFFFFLFNAFFFIHVIYCDLCVCVCVFSLSFIETILPFFLSRRTS